jgi:hypothetical protein
MEACARLRAMQASERSINKEQERRRPSQATNQEYEEAEIAKGSCGSRVCARRRSQNGFRFEDSVSLWTTGANGSEFVSP